MAKANPYDMNAKKENPTFVGLEFIEDLAVDHGDPLDIMIALEEDMDDGFYVDVVRAKWHKACTEV